MTLRLTGGLGILAASIWLSFEYLFLGSASVIIAADNTELLIPGFLSPEFAGMDNPLWDNFTAAGVDRMVNGHFAHLDIFLFQHLPGWLAHGLRIGSQILAAIIGVYLLCRRTLGFGEGASLFVALAYAVPLHPYLLHSVQAYLPIVLLALTFVFDDKTDVRRWAFLVVVVAVMAHTSFFSRLVPIASAMIVVWFLFIDTKKGAWNWLIILVTALAVVALRAPDVLAMMAFSPYSHVSLVRGEPDLMGVVRRTFWPTLFFASYTNAMFSILFIYAVIVKSAGDRHRNGVLLFLLLAGLALVPAVVAVQIALMDHFHFLRGYNLVYLGLLPSLILIFAAGYGIDTLLNQLRGSDLRGIGLWGRRAAVAVAVVILLLPSVKSKYASVLNWVTQGTYVRNFESPVLRDLADTIRAQPWPERAELFQLYPAYLHAYGIETAGGYVPLLYRRYYEFWGTMLAPWISQLRPGSFNYAMFTPLVKKIGGWLQFRGNRLMLMPEDYRPERRLGDLYRINFLSLANVGYIVSRDRLTDDSLEPVREMEKPWSSLDTRSKTDINVRANFTGMTHLFIYRNRDVFPRFFTAARITAFDSGRAVLNAMAVASVDELRRTVFVEKAALPPGVSPGDGYGTSPIHLERYASDEIRLAVETKKPTILIVGNSFSPFWVCEVDGVRTPIFPAYHAFWGVRLPAGAKSVTFRFAPPYQ